MGEQLPTTMAGDPYIYRLRRSLPARMICNRCGGREIFEEGRKLLACCTSGDGPTRSAENRRTRRVLLRERRQSQAVVARLARSGRTADLTAHRIFRGDRPERAVLPIISSSDTDCARSSSLCRPVLRVVCDLIGMRCMWKTAASGTRSGRNYT